MSDPDLHPIEYAAKRLGVSVDWMYRLAGRGEIAVTRVGRLVKFTDAAINDYIAAHTSEPRRSRKGTAA